MHPRLILGVVVFVFVFVVFRGVVAVVVVVVVVTCVLPAAGVNAAAGVFVTRGSVVARLAHLSDDFPGEVCAVSRIPLTANSQRKFSAGQGAAVGSSETSKDQY